MNRHTTHTSPQGPFSGPGGHMDEYTQDRTDRTHNIFPMLPLEVREEIYGYLLDSTLPSLNPLLPFQGLDFTVDPDYAIFHVNKETRIDAGLYCIRTKSFHIWSSDSRALFEYFLCTFSREHGFEAVRHLVFHTFFIDIPIGRLNPNIEFMLRCPNLRTVALTFRREWLVREIEKQKREVRNELTFGLIDSTPWLQASRDTAVETYGLRDLFRMKQIQKVELRLSCSWRLGRHGTILEYDDVETASAISDSLNLMGELRNWLASGFESLGQEVEVTTVSIYI